MQKLLEIAGSIIPGVSELSETVVIAMIAVGFFILIVLALWLLKTVIIAGLKAENEGVKLASQVVKSFKFPLFIISALYATIIISDFGALIEQWAYYFFVGTVIYYSVKAILTIVDFGANKISSQSGSEDKTKFLANFVKVIIWLIAILLALANFGYDVTSLLAGLGIGGLAIAMASQQILADVIGAFTIYFDKPFKIGDRIEVAPNYEGIVAKIGIRSVRLKSKDGEEIIIANGEIGKSKIKNFGK